VDPAAAPGDVIAQVQYLPEWAPAYYACLVEPLPTEPLSCVAAKLLDIVTSMDPVNQHLRYVYPDPDGSGYVIDHPLLVADALGVPGCI
jgi:hypothetical protein